jgi:sarcosine oxidase subunit alpha
VRAQPRLGYDQTPTRPVITPTTGSRWWRRQHGQGARRSVVIAQGAYEQPAVFRGNDLPGVMLASAAQRLLYQARGLSRARIAVLTANAKGYAAALDALAHGVELAAVLDLRAEARRAARRRAKSWRGAVCGALRRAADRGHRAQRMGRTGRFRVQGAARRAAQLELDGVWMSVGFAPANALLHQANARLTYERSVAQFVPQQLPRGGVRLRQGQRRLWLAQRIADGQRRRCLRCRPLGFGSEARERTPAPAGGRVSNAPLSDLCASAGKEFVDFDEDLQIKDLRERLSGRL